MAITLTGFNGAFAKAVAEKKALLARSVTGAIRKLEVEVKNAARAQARAGGLGNRFASAIRTRSYPKAGQFSAHPALIVHSAPPMPAFSRAALSY